MCSHLAGVVLHLCDVGLTNHSNSIAASAGKVTSWVTPSRAAQGEDTLLVWVARGANKVDYKLRPLNKMLDETYTVYFNVSSGLD